MKAIIKTKSNFKLNTMFKNKKPTRNFVKLLLCAIFLVACEHQIHTGQVVTKTYEEPRHYIYTTYIMIGKTMHPQFHTGFDDEDFILTVTGIKGKDTITEDFYVNEVTFNCMQQGQIFNDSIPCERDDDGLR
jgi:hypothetical protein